MKNNISKYLCKATVGGIILCSGIVGFYGGEEVQANSGIGVLVNGNKIEFSDADPFVEDGRTMVPLRGVFEAMGFSVNWYSDVWSGSSTDLQSSYGTTSLLVSILLQM